MAEQRSSRRMKRLLALVFRLDQHERFERSEIDSLDQQDRWCQRVATLIAKGRAQLGPSQLYQVAMICHHADADLSARGLAMAKRAATQGHKEASFLVAAITDSLLIRRGQPQKYGTQYQLDRTTGRWMLAPIDERTDDTERIALGLPVRREIRAEMTEWRIEPVSSTVKQAA